MTVFLVATQVQLPRWLSGEAHSLIKSLLERNVSKRLGGGKSSMFVVKGVQAIKRHAFFKVGGSDCTHFDENTNTACIFIDPESGLGENGDSSRPSS